MPRKKGTSLNETSKITKIVSHPHFNGHEVYSGKTVLITGGTGSFGKSFAKFLLKNSQLKKLIIYSRDEFKQYYMEKELSDERLRFFIGDVRDLPRLQRAFHEVDIVVHAAALKQVPSIEYNPFEAVKTNILGSQNVIDAAIDQNVLKILLISSDKAVQPINLYGATKLAAEKLFIAGNSYSGSKNILSVVRYGNVIGSRGSIVETLLKNVGDEQVQITDVNMTRFWLTLEQTFELVTTAISSMEGGEIFIPKIPSMKVIDLFGAIVPEAQIKVMGVRPGEKLHEILLTEHEARRSYEFDRYFVILPEYQFIKGKFEKYRKSGKPVQDGFNFNSNSNSSWVTKAQLRSLIEKISI